MFSGLYAIVVDKALALDGRNQNAKERRRRWKEIGEVLEGTRGKDQRPLYGVIGKPLNMSKPLDPAPP